MSGNILCCIKGVKDPFVAQEGRGFISRHCCGKGPHFTFRGESPGFSRVVAGNLGFLSSSNGNLRDVLVLPQEIQVSMRFARGLSRHLSRRCRGLCPHLKLRLEPQGSSPGLTWISGFLWSFNMGVWPCLFQIHGSPLSFRALKLMSGFLSS